jgi:IS4 transposase
MDRWYAQFTLLNDIHAAQSSYVCRVRDNSRYDVLETRPLSADALAASVLSDEVVALGVGSPAAKRPDHPVRLVQVRTTPSAPRGKTRGGKTGPPSDGVLRIATNLLDVPAEIIAEIYRRRWTIELFFRFFKHVLGCRHLLSTSHAGIEIQTYCAIIACLLLALWTGGQPTLRTFEMVGLYWQGWADQEELLAHLIKLKPRVA